MQKKIAFIGSFDYDERPDIRATSSAGNQVQWEIISTLTKIYRQELSHIDLISFKQLSTWPIGPLIWSGFKKVGFVSPPYLNFPILKRLTFSLSVLKYFIRNRPTVILKYNISLSDSIVLYTYKLLRPHICVCAIIQDVHCTRTFNASLSNNCNLLALKIACSFDMLIPISDKIIVDFNFPINRSCVFRGGLTRQGREILCYKGPISIPHYSVFAGTLESYNGIDLLVSIWISDEIDMDLHIFGKGSLESFVVDSAAKCSKIIYHGFKSEEDVTSFQRGAAINFCLRYSVGIEPGYFFPSKFFNILCAKGAVMTNLFHGFPPDLQNYCVILNNNLTDLRHKIRIANDSNKLFEMCIHRREWLESHANWGSVLQHLTKYH